MQNKLTLGLGVVLGVIAIVLVNVHVTMIEKNEAAVTILRATRQTGAGSSVEGRVETVTVPRRLAEALGSPIYQRDMRLLGNRPVKDDVPGGAFLLWSHFEGAQEGIDRQVLRTLPKGKRAMAVPVKFTSAVAGWVRPGDRVDVLATFKVPGAKGQTITYTMTLKQGMKVIAVGWRDRVNETMVRGRAVDRQPRSVILEVSPMEAEVLNFTIGQQSDITLTLRRPDDSAEVSVPRMNLDVLMNIRDSASRADG